MDKKRSNSKFLLGISVAVIVPVLCYLVVNEMSKGKVKMPGYYVVDKIERGDTTYRPVSDLVLTNQFGHQVSLNNDLKSKIVVVDFFFSTCTSTCPRLTRNMKMLQNSFRKDPKKEGTLDSIVYFVSITIDPKHDTFQVLRAYADHFGVNHDNWWFLTGDKKTIYDFARKDLQLAVGPGDGSAEDFIHPEVFALLDKDRYVRGYYDGMDEKEVRKCADDIVLLSMENKHTK